MKKILKIIGIVILACAVLGALMPDNDTSAPAVEDEEPAVVEETSEGDVIVSGYVDLKALAFVGAFNDVSDDKIFQIGEDPTGNVEYIAFTDNYLIYINTEDDSVIIAITFVDGSAPDESMTDGYTSVVKALLDVGNGPVGMYSDEHIAEYFKSILDNPEVTDSGLWVQTGVYDDVVVVGYFK